MFKTVQEGEEMEHAKREKVIAQKLHKLGFSLYCLKCSWNCPVLVNSFLKCQLLISNF